MSRPRRRLAALALGLCTAAVAAGCGNEIQLAESDPLYRGAELFNERCSGCHTFDVANADGSKAGGELEPGERTNGPNFNERGVDEDAALYAIRNGGFSGAIMPANIVVGEEAQLVAKFVAEYSGGGGVEFNTDETPSGTPSGDQDLE